jgi:hypothetical protein
MEEKRRRIELARQVWLTPTRGPLAAPASPGRWPCDRPMFEASWTGLLAELVVVAQELERMAEGRKGLGLSLGLGLGGGGAGGRSNGHSRSNSYGFGLSSLGLGGGGGGGPGSAAGTSTALSSALGGAGGKGGLTARLGLGGLLSWGHPTTPADTIRALEAEVVSLESLHK